MRPWILLLLALVTGCEGGGDPATEEGPAKHPLSGRVVEVHLEISEFDWEVAPGAIYKAVGYNRSIPGPIIEATAGDRIVIHLTNTTGAPRSIHTHVVRFPVESDGYTAGIAQPGETFTVTWGAVFAGSFPYHDPAGHGGETEGIRAGLIGALVVHDPDEPTAQLDNVVVLSDVDMSRYASMPEGAMDGEHGDHGYMHLISGRACEEWVPKFEAKVGDRVRWRVLSEGRLK